ncbi:MAG: hypothetical protein M0R32_06440 [Candidatus Cloacimonetes bacterium]|jgi:hypothetical protein|nr:hypothetical protein [Candidatus Cloacimonadota bacterium]
MDVEDAMTRRRSSKNSKPKNLKPNPIREKYIKDRLDAERLLTKKRHDDEMKLLSNVVKRAKEKGGCSSCTKRAIRKLRQRVKDLRKELGMPLYRIPGRNF